MTFTFEEMTEKLMELSRYSQNCAKFLGWEYIGSDDYPDWKMTDGTLIDSEDFKFHNDWNWIMMVINKIESLKDPFCTVQIERNICCIHVGGVDFKFVEENKMDSTIKSISSFLNWYHEIKS